MNRGMACSCASRAWPVLKESLQATSLKGVPRVFRAKQPPLKVLWVASVLGFLCFVILEVKDAVVLYLEYPTVINNDEVIPDLSTRVTQFPAVTFCNMKVIHDDEEQGFLTANQYMQEMNRNISQWEQLNPDEAEAMQKTFKGMMEISAYYEFIGKHNAVNIGAKIDTFIKRCTIYMEDAYEEVSCDDVGVFDVQSTADHFNCFTFHPVRRMEKQPYKVTFLLFLDAGDDFVSTTYSAEERDLQTIGVKMSLHSSSEPFDFKRKALLIPPGFMTAVNIGLSERKRLGEPYGGCQKVYNDAYFISHDTKVPYSRKGCQSACVQSLITESCGCRDPNMGVVATQDECNLPFCGRARQNFSERVESANCARGVSLMSGSNCRKSCNVPCEVLHVKPVLSFADWPRYSQHLGIYNSFIRGTSKQSKFQKYEDILTEYEANGNASDTLIALSKLSLIKSNFALVDIVRTEVTVDIVSDQVKTTSGDLVSTIGSLLNLYSGITVIIVIELLDFIYRLFALCLCPDEKPEEKEDEEKPKKEIALNSVNGVMSIRI